MYWIVIVNVYITFSVLLWRLQFYTARVVIKRHFLFCLLDELKRAEEGTLYTRQSALKRYSPCSKLFWNSAYLLRLRKVQNQVQLK